MTSNEIADDVLLEAAARFGTPAFVYSTESIGSRIASLRSAFGERYALSYAVKSNPNPELLGWLKDHVEFLDVSSIGELRLARRGGWDVTRASFTGPGKRDFELSEALMCGIGELVLESTREALVCDRLAEGFGRVQDVLVRVAPASIPNGFGDHMAGRPSAFGIDVEDIHTELPRILALRKLRVTGFHMYSGTQCLKPSAICDNYRIFIDVFSEICKHFDLTPSKLIFGSGLGIPYHDGDVPIDPNVVAEGIAGDLDALKQQPRFRNTRLILELGRWLVGPAGVFLTRVVSTKSSRGIRFVICDGGMNNHLAASGHFGMVMLRNYSMHRVGGGELAEKVNLVGPLCTSIDRLAYGVLLPRLAEGDLIAVHSSGSYGLTASPIHFISHAPPREILFDRGQLRDVTRGLGDL